MALSRGEIPNASKYIEQYAVLWGDEYGDPHAFKNTIHMTIYQARNWIMGLRGVFQLGNCGM